ncbi:LysR family transcriptional regulator [Roseicyclus sp. F158]|uniref:LysR family transcriptional regulator n=1 Tax=Tropicimonas omnivorans TaxID=3075590 RepID=A0ABU3DCM7_9RHOB|nr:LysR family transcriptional regulator [Roseicyclus sp. F158]MDT0681452.1 LysR family transcriptional regulator [Roseicyclus sp. F158]
MQDGTARIPNLRHVAGIEAIGREGTLSAAAAAVSLSQPAMTQGLAAVEHSVGTPLFLRTRSGMTPTEAGEIYLRRIHRGLALLRRAGQAAGRPNLWRMVSLGQLAALIAAVEHGGIRPAAAALGREASTISRGCRGLSDLAGLPLFEATSHGMTPSRPARDLARLGHLALAELEQARLDVADWQGSFGGRIVVGCLPLAQPALLPEALCRFAGEFPTVAISVADGLYPALAQDLRHGRIDLLIGALREENLPDGVTERILFSDNLCIAARPGHPLVRGPASDADLARFPWIAPRSGAPSRAHFDALQARLAPDGCPRPIETGSSAVIAGLLARSDRLALVSRTQVEDDLAAGRLSLIETEIPDSPRAIGYAHRSDWLPSVPQARFLEIFEDVVARPGLS